MRSLELPDFHIFEKEQLSIFSQEILKKESELW